MFDAFDGIASGLSMCRVPCDYILEKSYPLFQARDLLQSWATGLQRGEWHGYTPPG